MRKTMFLVLAVMAMCALPASALPSLHPGDWEDITITIRGTRQTFTVIEDAQNPAMWYYVQRNPQLAEENGTPVFQLLKYQAADETEKEKEIAGGVLQFAVNLALPAEAQTAIRKRIFEIKSSEWKQMSPGAVDDLEAKRKLQEKDMKLTCLPLSSASVAIYDLGGKLAAQGGLMGGIAPTFANQDMVFQIKLNKLGTDLYTELVKGNTGIPCVFAYAFKGISPKNGFKAEIDWDQTFRHYTSDKKTRDALGGWLYSWTDEKHTSELRQLLTSSKCLRITTLSGDAMSDEEQDRYLEPIMKRINDELLDAVKPPEQIDAAQSSQTAGGGWLGGGGLSFATREASRVRKGRETVTFDKQKVMTSRGGCGAFIGLSKYSPEIREKCITVMPPGNWANAMFALPSVGDDPRLGIAQIDLIVGMVDKNGQPLIIDTDKKGEASTIPQQAVTWTPDRGYWCSPSDKTTPREALLFPMSHLYASLTSAKIRDLRYKIRVAITQKIKSSVFRFESDSLQPVIDGDIPLSTPFDCVEPLTVNAGLLNFLLTDKTSDLKQISAKVDFGDAKGRKTVSASISDPAKGTEMVFLIAKDKPFRLAITYSVAKLGQVPWKYNTFAGDLREVFPGLEILPEQGEWRPGWETTIDTTGE